MKQKLFLTNCLSTRIFLEPMCHRHSSGTTLDSLYTYFVKVNDCKKAGEKAPYEYVTEDIAKIVLNKRKLKLIKSTYEKIYQESLRTNDFEIF